MTQVCPDCGGFLSNHGAESCGDGDVYDVWYCIDCHCAKYHVHARYCECQACTERGLGHNTGEVFIERVYEEPEYDFWAPY
jgi:hypothetical protein